MLENTVKQYLLDNPHSLLMVLKPEPGLQAKISAAAEEELKAYKAGLTEEQIEELIGDTQALIEYQKQEDTPEALASIPMLERSDISSEVEWFDVKKQEVAGVDVVQYEEFTNDILYSNLYFDVRVLPAELISYAKLLSSVMGKLNTENYSFGDLDNTLNINTGGFSTYLTTYLEDQSNENILPKFAVYSKATSEKAGKMFELVNEVINHSKINDPERLKELITRHHARVDSDIKNNGLNYAMTRLTSYYSKSGMYNEKTQGLDYYRFVSDVAENFDTKSDEIIANLEKTASLLFSKENLIATITCSEKDFAGYSAGLESFVAAVKEAPLEWQDWNFDYEKKNEGLESASKVQYVVKGYDFKKLGYEYDGKMRVLNQVLSTDWLQNQVRVIGGAYGGFAGISQSGTVYFASYRDPNLKETIDTYDKTPGYLDEFEADDNTMTRYIIGTISRMDGPKTASQKGNLAIEYYFEKTTPEQLKAEREAVLATTAGDIKGMKKLVEDVLAQDAICVYGNEEKVKENAGLFGSVVSLTE